MFIVTRRLAIALDGPCAGHPCDNCDGCGAGICCASEVEQAILPEEGAWKGQSYAEIGEIRERDGMLQCACCGGWFENLAQHTWQIHDLRADEYRALWGLRCGQRLVGERISAMRRARAVGRSAEHIKAMNDSVTPEQRSAWGSGRWNRTQAVQEGQPLFTTEWQSNAARAAWAKPGSRTRRILARRRKIGERPVIECPVCRALFCNVPAKTPRKSCNSKECQSELKRRAANARKNKGGGRLPDGSYVPKDSTWSDSAG